MLFPHFHGVHRHQIADQRILDQPLPNGEGTFTVWKRLIKDPLIRDLVAMDSMEMRKKHLFSDAFYMDTCLYY